MRICKPFVNHSVGALVATLCVYKVLPGSRRWFLEIHTTHIRGSRKWVIRQGHSVKQQTIIFAFRRSLIRLDSTSSFTSDSVEDNLCVKLLSQNRKHLLLSFNSLRNSVTASVNMIYKTDTDKSLTQWHFHHYLFAVHLITFDNYVSFNCITCDSLLACIRDLDLPSVIFCKLPTWKLSTRIYLPDRKQRVKLLKTSSLLIQVFFEALFMDLLCLLFIFQMKAVTFHYTVKYSVSFAG